MVVADRRCDDRGRGSPTGSSSPTDQCGYRVGRGHQVREGLREGTLQYEADDPLVRERNYLSVTKSRQRRVLPSWEEVVDRSHSASSFQSSVTETGSRRLCAAIRVLHHSARMSARMTTLALLASLAGHRPDEQAAVTGHAVRRYPDLVPVAAAAAMSQLLQHAGQEFRGRGGAGCAPRAGRASRGTHRDTHDPTKQGPGKVG